MRFSSWLRNWTSNGVTRKGARHRAAPPRFRPQLEALENRIVPSTLIVNSAADSGAGSLRAEIAAASSGDTIKFAGSLKGQTITLTSGELALDKSLDIEGLGPGHFIPTAAGRARWRP